LEHGCKPPIGQLPMRASIEVLNRDLHEVPKSAAAGNDAHDILLSRYVFQACGPNRPIRRSAFLPGPG
jgi:hypothetical protein